jgi:uncharacterized protein YukE
MIATQFPVESIALLAGQLNTQATTLQAQLDQLRVHCQRDPNFQGTAATKYDEYMAEWDTHQKGLMTALHGAQSLLQQLADHLVDVNQRYTTAFTF